MNRHRLGFLIVTLALSINAPAFAHDMAEMEEMDGHDMAPNAMGGQMGMGAPRADRACSRRARYTSRRPKRNHRSNFSRKGSSRDAPNRKGRWISVMRRRSR